MVCTKSVNECIYMLLSKHDLRRLLCYTHNWTDQKVVPSNLSLHSFTLFHFSDSPVLLIMWSEKKKFYIFYFQCPKEANIMILFVCLFVYFCTDSKDDLELSILCC